MLLFFLGSAVVGVSLGYIIVCFIIPWLVPFSGPFVLLWHEVILEPAMDWLKGSSKPQRMLSYVQRHSKRGDPDSVISTIDIFCRSKEWAMNVGDEKGLILDKLICEANPSIVLELGTYCGYSSLRIARLLPPGGRLFTMEFNPAYAKIAKQIIAWAGLESKIQVLEGPSGDLIPQLKKKHAIEKCDIIFIDHWKDCYLPDTKLLEECGLIGKGTVLIADNVTFPGTPDYLEYVRNSPHYSSQYFKSYLEYSKTEDGLEKSVFLG
uniref:catechol O-methyltransferase n=1 Tax=Erpetoichthys calabaricus TaxID=27687 RepID=A0A8C4S6V5_ERPCA